MCVCAIFSLLIIQLDYFSAEGIAYSSLEMSSQRVARLSTKQGIKLVCENYVCSVLAIPPRGYQMLRYMLPRENIGRSQR